MTQRKIRIVDITQSNIEDLIFVCSSKKLTDPIHQHGMKLKRDWLKEMIANYGTCAKIAYLDDKPVAQALFYPETADPTRVRSREGVLILKCVYNPTIESQKLGIGKRLLDGVVRDAKSRKLCLGGRPCKFILANAFDTGELLSLPAFYAKNGFKPTSEDGMLWLPIEGAYERVPSLRQYQALPEDMGRAVMFYSPVCQFSYQFARKVEEIISQVAPSVKIDLTNDWRQPSESIKRAGQWLVVNAKPIHTFFMDTERFKQEIKDAVSD